jgi:hypothetical protein
MPIKFMSVDAAEQKFRQTRRSTIIDMPEWQDLRTRLAAEGLKPSEACVIEIKPNPKAPHTRASFKRNLKKLLRRLNLTAYTVRAMRDAASGMDIIIVENTSAQPTSPSRKRA